MTKILNILQITFKVSFLTLITTGLICVLFTLLTEDASTFTFNI